MKVIRMLDKGITFFCSVILVILCIVMIGSASIQVFSRVVLQNSFGWTDELCRYSMVWLALFAGGMAVKQQSHVSVNLLRDKLSKRSQSILMRIIAGITLVFSSAMTYYGVLLMVQNMKQITTGLQLPMGMVYACLPLGGSVMIFYSILQLLGLSDNSDKEGYIE